MVQSPVQMACLPAAICRIIHTAPADHVTIGEPMSRVPSRRTIANLPQTSETWQIAVAKLRTWIVSADGRPTRPSAIFVFDPYEGIIIYTELVEPARIPDGVADVLLKGMRKPLPGGGAPRRPATIALS